MAMPCHREEHEYTMVKCASERKLATRDRRRTMRWRGGGEVDASKIYKSKITTLDVIVLMRA